MSKRTVVSDYIQNKLNNIKKDQFLESISKESFYRQNSLVAKEINQINDYIAVIKSNKNSYEVVNGKKKLKPVLTNYIKSLKQIILKYQQYIKYLTLLNNYNNRSARIKEKIEIENSQFSISNNQLRLLDTISTNSIKNYSFNDLVVISKYVINNYETFDNHNLLFDVLKEVINRFLESKYNEEDYVSISSIKCLLNHKINSLDKEDILRKPLHNLKKYIKSSLERSQKVLELKHDYRYEIVEYLFENEYYFNRVIEEMPDIVNLTDKDGNSLAYNIICEYLDKYLLELQGKKVDIPKEKYARMYRTVINSLSYHADCNNLEAIEKLLNGFKETIKNSKFKRDKYLEVLEELDNLNSDEIKTNDNIEFNLDKIFIESKYILNKQVGFNRVDLREEDTIVLTTPSEKYHNYAYSVSKDEKGIHTLKVHITDMRSFIDHNSELNNFLKHYIFYNEQNWLDDKLMKKFSLEKGEEKPAMTFEIKVLSTGEIKGFKVYKSTICVNDIYLMDEAHQMIKNHNLRFLPFLEISYFLNKNVDKDNYGVSMSNTFNKTVLDVVGKYFDDNKLPYIYKGQDKQDIDHYMQTMTLLNSLFTKITKEQFNKFYKIICEDTNYSQYTSKCKHHYCLDQKYYTDLLIPLYSYIGLHLQELINQFYFKDMPNEILKIKKSIWDEENKYLIKNANFIKEEKRQNKHKAKMKALGKN